MTTLKFSLFNPLQEVHERRHEIVGPKLSVVPVKPATAFSRNVWAVAAEDTFSRIPQVQDSFQRSLRFWKHPPALHSRKKSDVRRRHSLRPEAGAQRLVAVSSEKIRRVKAALHFLELPSKVTTLAPELRTSLQHLFLQILRENPLEPAEQSKVEEALFHLEQFIHWQGKRGKIQADLEKLFPRAYRLGRRQDRFAEFLPFSFLEEGPLKEKFRNEFSKRDLDLGSQMLPDELFTKALDILSSQEQAPIKDILNEDIIENTVTSVADLADHHIRWKHLYQGVSLQTLSQEYLSLQEKSLNLSREYRQRQALLRNIVEIEQYDFKIEFLKESQRSWVENLNTIDKNLLHSLREDASHDYQWLSLLRDVRDAEILATTARLEALEERLSNEENSQEENEENSQEESEWVEEELHLEELQKERNFFETLLQEIEDFPWDGDPVVALNQWLTLEEELIDFRREAVDLALVHELNRLEQISPTHEKVQDLTKAYNRFLQIQNPQRSDYQHLLEKIDEARLWAVVAARIKFYETAEKSAVITDAVISVLSFSELEGHRLFSEYLQGYIKVDGLLRAGREAEALELLTFLERSPEQRELSRMFRHSELFQMCSLEAVFLIAGTITGHFLARSFIELAEQVKMSETLALALSFIPDSIGFILVHDYIGSLARDISFWKQTTPLDFLEHVLFTACRFGMMDFLQRGFRRGLNYGLTSHMKNKLLLRGINSSTPGYSKLLEKEVALLAQRAPLELVALGGNYMGGLVGLVMWETFQANYKNAKEGRWDPEGALEKVASNWRYLLVRRSCRTTGRLVGGFTKSLGVAIGGR